MVCHNLSSPGTLEICRGDQGILGFLLEDSLGLRVVMRISLQFEFGVWGGKD